ncbi:MAG TPA: redox-sensing transcriptional repressor Rex [Armatimonadota bacterium]|jgi:redox-sensing transcriptional repressor
MTKEKRLSRASVLRLELYLEVLEQFQRDKREFATSNAIGEAAGVPPVKVRQDLFGLGSAGRPKIGYDVSHLVTMIRGVFDLDREKSACIIGFGNLGRALAGSNIWSKAGYKLVAIFDNDPAVIGSDIGSVRVRNITEIFGVVRNEGIEMAVVAVPVSAAQDLADILVAAGIGAIWNFAPTKLQTPSNVIVENQSLAWGLITLSQRTKFG